MKNQLQIFENEEFGKIRIVEIDGLPWFVGMDVTAVLGYENNSRDINRHVDKEDRLNYRNGSLEKSNRGVTIINESGLYSLILSSKLPTAKAFKRWVTSDILPLIRKHGAYITDELLRRIKDGDELADALIDQLVEEKIQKRTLIGAIGTLAPKARYCDIILQCADAVQTSIIAKDYGMSAINFNKLLHDMGVQFRIGKTWLLYKAFAGLGYTVSKTYYIDGKIASIQTCWTQAGRFWLYEFLKQRGILPDSEKETSVYQTRMDTPN